MHSPLPREADEQCDSLVASILWELRAIVTVSRIALTAADETFSPLQTGVVQFDDPESLDQRLAEPSRFLRLR